MAAELLRQGRVLEFPSAVSCCQVGRVGVCDPAGLHREGDVAEHILGHGGDMQPVVEQHSHMVSSASIQGV